MPKTEPRKEPQPNRQTSSLPPKSSGGQTTTEEKLLLDRVTKRCATRDRMIATAKVRFIVSGIIIGLGLLSLLGTLSGGKEGVRNSLFENLKWSKEARDAGFAGSDYAAGMVADVTGLTDLNISAASERQSALCFLEG